MLEAPPFCVDGDIGAEHIWRLSSAYDPDEVRAVYERSDWSYRRWGYVLWDYERLQALSALERPWMPSVERESYLPSAAIMEMQASWLARTAIYWRRGRGYWAKDDESRIVWPERCKRERPGSCQRTVPGSLVEAKDFWRKLSLPNSGESLLVGIK